jgi:hypothetical protein
VRGWRKGWRHAGALHRDWQREIFVLDYLNQGAQRVFRKGRKVLCLLRKAGQAAWLSETGSQARVSKETCVVMRLTTGLGGGCTHQHASDLLWLFCLTA